jgi:hypothetical protein
MKISKSLLQAIAIAVVIGTTVQACTKETPVNPSTQKPPADSCPACGMG